MAKKSEEQVTREVERELKKVGAKVRKQQREDTDKFIKQLEEGKDGDA
jgi:hypothetical protein